MYVQTTAAMLKKPTKSIEQQRLDALKYAEKLWGPNIGKLSPSPSPSKLLSPISCSISFYSMIFINLP
jgi:hypothetical protein